MPRTTIDIDAPVLRDLRRLQKQERKSLSRLVSDLLSRALGDRRQGASRPSILTWTSRPMRARIDLDDKEAVRAVLDRDA